MLLCCCCLRNSGDDLRFGILHCWQLNHMFLVFVHSHRSPWWCHWCSYPSIWSSQYWFKFCRKQRYWLTNSCTSHAKPLIASAKRRFVIVLLTVPSSFSRHQSWSSPKRHWKEWARRDSPGRPQRWCETIPHGCHTQRLCWRLCHKDALLLEWGWHSCYTSSWFMPTKQHVIAC